MKSGIINVYKEAGFTSFDVVAKMRGILHVKKIGHTGTLDPDATGVLPVCIGKATKVCDLMTDKDKTYQAIMHLGIVTDTQDMTGTVLEEHEVLSLIHISCVELLQAGYDVVVLDNLSNASEKSLERVKAITGKEVTFYKGDILDRDILNQIMDKEQIDSCIHFAGLKAVGESVEKPWEYYNNNIAGTLTLVDVMRQHGIKNIIFSSSATVYGNPAQIPITEECPKGQCTNPYGWTKSMLEQILTDMQKADPEWNVILLRYFNPIGAHPSGTMGENPNGIPNNLMPYITQVAVGKLKELGVFGRCV